MDVQTNMRAHTHTHTHTHTHHTHTRTANEPKQPETGQKEPERDEKTQIKCKPTPKQPEISNLDKSRPFY